MEPVPARYHELSIAAHWLTLALLIAVYALMEFRGVFPNHSVAHDTMKAWHYTLGLTVFGVVFVRVALRFVFHAPPIMPESPAWQRAFAAAMHAVLYGFLIAMPLLGWLTLSAKGESTPFFGRELPALLAPDKALGRKLEGIHETIGNIGYYLIGLHAAAALFHHYWRRDNTLARMLPWRDQREHAVAPELRP